MLGQGRLGRGAWTVRQEPRGCGIVRTRVNAGNSEPDQHQVPAGVRAMKAAYEYLDAIFESPGIAALQWGVGR